MTRHLFGSAALLLLAGCPYLGDEGYTDRVRDVDGDGFIAERFGGPDCRDDDPSIGNCDADGDGYRTVAVGGEDCDDTSASVNPDASEACNGLDDDCDGLIDNDDADVTSEAPLWFADVDADGHGDADVSRAFCGDTPPVGYVASSDDCDDTTASVAPTADEICDEIDHDCDGDPYANALQPPTWLSDSDGDGFGNEDDVLAVQCEAPEASAVRASGGSDCEPADASVYPGAVETPYDGIDQDCDGVDLTDVDGDGFDGGVGGTDCDDTRGSANPLAQEVCNGEDDDCDGSADNGFLPDGVTPVLTAFYPDVDGDLRGDDAAAPVLACVAPANHVNQQGDCDDGVPTTYVGAPERCNNVDDDCDTFVDDDPLDGVRLYRDRDLDLYGDASISEFACEDDFDPAFNWVTNDDDCDDTSAQASPVGIETCDGLDNDCNGATDDGVGEIYYVDSDGDGFGNPTQPILACSTADGELSTLDTDCNDADPNVNPAAEDICGDGFRQDCRTDVSPFDCDDDGFEDVAVGGTDCDDSEPTVNPAATEICDAFDNDCDGLTNLDDSSLDLSTVGDFYQDLDQDGFGTNVLVAANACDPIPGASQVRGDCDDSDPAIQPEALEVCDGIDNDCDDVVDDVAEEDRTLWYPDGDGDGDGDRFAVAAFQQCDDPGPGFVSLNGDCRDDVEEVSSLAAEICDGFDNDCDTLFDDDDDDVVADAWYVDDDGDGYGRTASAVFSCDQPLGTVALAGDCDDTKVAKSPGSLEICDGLDNDCDGLVDDNDSDVTGNVAWVRDGDGDGYGAETPPSDDPSYVEGDRALQCAQPIGFVLEVPGREDCDDTSATVNPAAFEVCDSRDNDCNELADDEDPNLAFAPSWYPDGDDDGWGDGNGLVASACSPPADHVQFPGDCNDGDISVNPLAPEVCDGGIDNDCDGLDESVDPDASIPSWWPDGDGDGFGDAASMSVSACEAPSFGVGVAAVQIAGDCDDLVDTSFPGAPERCNGEDDDCDGATDDDAVDAVVHWADSDNDGYGDPSGATETYCSGDAPLGFVGNDDDCEDADTNAFPGAPERCNGQDDDCDLLVDEDPQSGGTTWAYDGDQDGYGDLNTTLVACSVPAPANLWVDPIMQPVGDCNVANGTVYPGAPEICDGIDNDCNPGTPIDDGVTTLWYLDTDGDGFGDAGDMSPVSSCQPVGGRAATNTDCDDSTSAANPAQSIEDCDGIDNDCDGFVDDDDPDSTVIGLSSYWLDLDGDGYGIDAGLVDACDPPVAYAAQPGDCDDGSSAINPSAVETCDDHDIDEDCNGFADNDDLGLVADTDFLVPDIDGDGVGTQDDAFDGCPEEGFVAFSNGDDCDDLNDRLTGPAIWRRDLDDDGYADPAGPPLGPASCLSPGPLSSPLAIDCDDTLGTIAPYRTILVGPGGDTNNLQTALDDLTCVKNEILILSGYSFAPGLQIILPEVPVEITANGLALPQFVADQPGVDAAIRSASITVGGGETGLTQSDGRVELENIAFVGSGAGAGMFVSDGITILRDVLCDEVGEEPNASCLEHSTGELVIDGLNATNNPGIEPVIRVVDSMPGSKMTKVSVHDASATEFSVLIDSALDLVVEDLQVERSGGVLLTDSIATSNVEISRLRLFQINNGDGALNLELTNPASKAVIQSALIYDSSMAGIRDISGSSNLEAHYLTVVGATTGLQLDPSGVVVDHSVFFDNSSDLESVPTTPLADWDHNRFGEGGAAAVCGGLDCLDADDGFVPEFIAYAPQLQPDLLLPLARVGGNLWNRDPGESDRNGTAADLGFSGGPQGWTDVIYLTFDDVIPDIWEETFFRDVPGYSPSLIDPQGDRDGDGLSNLEEYERGTHPDVADTDGDLELDGDEVLLGCDPLDPSSSVLTGSCP